MKQNDQIKRANTTSFLDIGGVLRTDGWSHGFRKLAARVFDLNQEDLEKRHNQAFGTYELGKLTTEERLNWVECSGVECG